MKPTATFPTPYGISVPVCEDPSRPGEFLFDMEATAICVGIYDTKERKRFASDVAAAGRCDMDRLADYGGGKPQRLLIQRPESPAFPQIRHFDAVVPIDAWVTAIMEQHRWCDRADVLLEIVGDNFDHWKNMGGKVDPVLSLAMQVMLSAALEHLTEGEIECLEAAAFLRAVGASRMERARGQLA